MNKPETTPPTYFHHIRDGTENARLKKLVAELSLDKAVLQDVLSKEFPGPLS